MNKPQELEYEFDREYSVRCRTTEKCLGAGLKGYYYGQIAVGSGFWVIVLWDGNNSPHFHKPEEIEIEEITYKNAGQL